RYLFLVVCVVFLISPRPRRPALFPYTTLFRSVWHAGRHEHSSEMDGPIKRSGRRPNGAGGPGDGKAEAARQGGERRDGCRGPNADRKSTRLNSSHGSISYAVFCLQKKKRTQTQ